MMPMPMPGPIAESPYPIMLTLPGFGLLPAVEAIPHARAGFDAAPEPEEDE